MENRRLWSLRRSWRNERPVPGGCGAIKTEGIDVEDIQYIHRGDKPPRARPFKPRGTRPVPLMAELHGVAWCRGDRFSDPATNEAFWTERDIRQYIYRPAARAGSQRKMGRVCLITT